MAVNFHHRAREGDRVDARNVDAVQELSRLRMEVDELRAARRRLVLAADDDRRAIERALHDGVHQRLVAVAVGLQLVRRATASDPNAVTPLLEEVGADLEQALEETTLLAQRTFPVSLELDGLAALLRAAAVSAGISASVEVQVGSSCPPEVVMTIYRCWLNALACADGETPPTIRVRDDGTASTFDLVGAANFSDAELERVRDRVEALGGQVTTEPAPADGIRVSGRLPLTRWS
jgi:signal transduction histidine kinase